MNKTILGLVLVPLILSGCVKKAEEKPVEKTENASTIKTTEQSQTKENQIPAIIAHSFLVKFEQPKICGSNPDVEGIVCTSKEAIALKSNIDWIDQVIDKEIRKNYADALTPASEQQKQLNQHKLRGLITGQIVWFIALMDSLVNMCKFQKLAQNILAEHMV